MVAAEVQRILADITPDERPDRETSIPVLFGDWLEQWLVAYPGGCMYVFNNRLLLNLRAEISLVNVPTTFGMSIEG
jgi:hypothetical protein